MSQLTMVYHLAPNTVLIVGGSGGCSISQHWPAGSVDKCTAELSSWSRELPPNTAEAAAQRKAQFGGFMDLFVGEDFQILSNMHQNFSANKDIEVLIGRHEPCLADRHRFYAEAVAEAAAATK